MVSSPLAMLLFATPLECNGSIYYLPAGRAETYRSIRAPVVHVGAGDSSSCQLLSLDSGQAQETSRILAMTVELCGFTFSRLAASRQSPNPHRIDERLGLPEYVCALA